MRKFFTTLCAILSLFQLYVFAQPEEPAGGWSIYPPPQNTSEYSFFIGDGIGKNLEEAKESARMDLKRAVAESIEINTSVDSSQIEHIEESYKYRGQVSYSILDSSTSSFSNVKILGLNELVWEGLDAPKNNGFWEVSVLGYISTSDIEKSREETKIWQKEEEQPYYAYKNLQILFRQAGKEKEFLQDAPASYAKWVKEKCLVLQNPLDDKKNSDWPGLFSEFLQKLFRSAISTNTVINDKPSCVVYDRAYSERIKSVLKRNGIKCVQDGNYLYIYAESTNAFRSLVTSMKNPTRIALYVDQIFDVEAEINSKSLSESLSKIFSDYLAKKDRELKCDIRLKPFSKRDFESLDARYAVSLEVNFSYTKREKKYVDEKQTYNLNIEINEKFFDSVYTDSSGYTVGKIEKSYLADSSKFKPLKPDVDFIITKTKDAVLYLSKKDGANTISFLVDAFLELM